MSTQGIHLNDARQLVAGIDVTNQHAIDALKAKHPGIGIGVCVQDKITAMIMAGDILSAASIPSEYRNQLSPLLS